MFEELMQRNYDGGPTEAPMQTVNEARIPPFDFNHLTETEFRKRFNITIEHMDMGCIVQIGCKKIAFENYEIALSIINKFYKKPHDTAKEWKDRLSL